MDETDGPPYFDEAKAQGYLGQYVLIGISYYSHSGDVVRLEQIHGRIAFADREKGIMVELKGKRDGATKWFPPNIQSLELAKPGEYTLRETGEVITDPDLLWTWNVSLPLAQDLKQKKGKK